MGMNTLNLQHPSSHQFGFVSPLALFGTPAVQPKQLFDDQQAAIDALRGALRQGFKHPMMYAPTAAGKTVIASAISRSALAKWFAKPALQRKPHAVLFMVDAKALLTQTFDCFTENGIPVDQIGILGDGKRLRVDAPILIATYQTLKNRKPIDLAEMVIIDEAHSLPKFYREWMTMPEWLKIPFVGLSATPGTPELGKFFDKLVTVSTTKELIGKGRLSPFVVYAPESHIKPDLEGVPLHKGDYQEKALEGRMSTPELIGDAPKEWLKRGENRPTLCFAINRAHAMKLVKEFQRHGIKTGYIDKDTLIEEREEIRRKLEAREIHVVFSINCLVKGVDWPFVSCIILQRPTKNPWTYVQIVGRGLRTCKDKLNCIILDCTDTTVNLGFVDDIYFDELDDGTQKDRTAKKKEPGERKEAKPAECLKCGYLKPLGVRKCPDCGWEPQPQSDIENAPGDLIKLEGKKLKADKDTKQAWYSGLLAMAFQRPSVNNKKGWAANKYREKFGCWPRLLREVVGVVTDEIRSFVRHCDITWSKRVTA
jgi:DNA repair protein RadD